MNNKGFTLIELVIVIIVLGILSATAVPKFINLQNDAKTSVLQGTKAAMMSSMNIAHSKLVIEGMETNAGLVSKLDAPTLEWCQDCKFSYGYPKQNYLNTWLNIMTGVSNGWVEGKEIDEFDGIVIVYTHEAEPKTIVTLADNLNEFRELINDDCYILYEEPKSIIQAPVLTLFECE